MNLACEHEEKEKDEMGRKERNLARAAKYSVNKDEREDKIQRKERNVCTAG